MRVLTPPTVIGLCAALVLAAGTIAVAVGAVDGRTPGGTATDYLTALQQGDVTRALALSTHPATLDTSLLQQDLPDGSRITAAKTTAVTTRGKTATVLVSYRLDGADYAPTLKLSQHGHGWLIDNGVSKLRITGAAADATEVIVNGQPVKVHAGSATVPAMPGSYQGVLGTDFAFTGDSVASAVSNDLGYLSIRLTSTKAAEAVASKAALRAVTTCFAKARTLDSPCGSYVPQQDDDHGRLKITDIRWAIVHMPKVTAGNTYFDDTIQVRGTASGTARMSCTLSEPSVSPLRVPYSEVDEFSIDADVTFHGSKATVRLR